MNGSEGGLEPKVGEGKGNEQETSTSAVHGCRTGSRHSAVLVA